MSRPQVELTEAQKAYHRKDFTRASAILRKILKGAPSFFQAAHLLAIIEFERQNLKVARKSFLCAIESAQKTQAPPEVVLSLTTDYAYILSTSGDYHASNEVADSGLALQPNSAQLLFFKSYNLRKLGLFDEASAIVDRLLALNSNNPDALCERGQIFLGLDRDEDAFEDFKRAAALAPNFSYAYYGQAEVLARRTSYYEASDFCKKAISLNPSYAEAYNLLAACLITLADSHQTNNVERTSRLGEALESCNKAISLKADFAEAYCNRGVTLYKLGRLYEALDAHEKTIELTPRSAHAYYNRGITLNELGRLDEAIASHDRAIELNPDHSDAYRDRGVALREKGQLNEALAGFNTAITLNRNSNDAHYDKAWSLLQLGDFKNGLVEYEWRSHRPSFPETTIYTGSESIAGKHIVVVYELYMGDAIQFCRYCKLLIEKDAIVTFAAPKRIARLISTLDDRLNVTELDDASTRYDYYVPMMSLPFVFKTEIDTIPNAIPYLFAEDALRQKWLSRLGDQGFKVAICWKGGNSLPGRSFPLSFLIGASKIPGVRLISIQMGAGVEEIESLRGKFQLECLTDQFDADQDAFIDTAAIMTCCDLVISCDTAAAHLAGALGVRTWVALRQYPEWRWLLDRSDSPWYPTMRLFRQKQDGEWKNVFDEIEAALRAEVSGR